MKNFSVSLALGLVALLGLIIYTTPRGPERIVDGILTAISIMLITGGASGLIVSLGWAIGYASRNALEHRAPNVERETRIIERHTIDGRIPHAPQIMTMPGAFDQYPAQFGQYINGARVDAAHQLQPPAQTGAPQLEAADLDAIYQPAEW